MKQHLFKLLSEFENWQNRHALNEYRLVQHDLVLAHLARLYGGIQWNQQVFGLISSPTIDIQEHQPTTLSELLAVTATGQLLVCDQADIPECQNPTENNGLFAIAKPIPMSSNLSEIWPEFPLSQVRLEWRAWQAGLDELANSGDGLPLGRFNNGQWDTNYIPPLMNVAADERLSQSATQLLTQVKQVANRDSRVAELVFALQPTDLANITPADFWQAHYRCLVALKTHPKLADDSDYHARLSELASSEGSDYWDGENRLVPLCSIWEVVEKRLLKESERQKGMDQLMKRVDKLAKRDGRVADLVFALQQQQTDWTTESPRAFWQSHCRCLVALKAHPKLADDSGYQQAVSKLLSENFSPWVIGDGLEPLRSAWKRVEQGLDNKDKPTPKPLGYVSLGWYAASMAAIILLAALLGLGLFYQYKSMNELKTVFENQLAALDDGLSKRVAEVDDGLSKRVTEVDEGLSKRVSELDNKQNQTVQALGILLTALNKKQAETTEGLSKQITQVDDNLSKRVAEVDDNLSKRVAEVDDNLSKRLTEVDDGLSKQITEVDEGLSKRLAGVENRQTTEELSKRLTEVEAERRKAEELRLAEERRKAEELRLAEKRRKAEELRLAMEERRKARELLLPECRKNSSPPTPSKEILRDRLKDGSEGPEMVVIPAGTFCMGDIQGGGASHEQSVHQVSIDSFAMGRYEVTVAEYDKFADATGRAKPYANREGRGNQPVISVSWHDATAYAQWLSEQTGHQYRLPTEAEWEYAARAGTVTKYWWGNDIGSNNANCDSRCGDSYQLTAPVGSFAANPFGLFDTAGNVWEWTCSEYQDPYAGKEQQCAQGGSRLVLRGGSWLNRPIVMRSSYRYIFSDDFRYQGVGFRLARSS